MSAIQGKSHCMIDGYLFMIARHPRSGMHMYGREEAPQFVNKFGSGDPNYRDATFFPHWVQNNWLNGFDQTKFNDGGKFFRSSKMDTTTQESLQLEKSFTSAGITTAGAKILTQLGWRASAASFFGSGSDGALVISADTTEDPIDSQCGGTNNSNTLTVNDLTAAFVPGQYVLIVQTRGNANTPVGSKQKNKITGYVSGTITLETPLNASYFTYGINSGTTADRAQVYVMKQYSSVTINSGITWTAKLWDGGQGGILGFLCNGTFLNNGTINGNGRGYTGGSGSANSSGSNNPSYTGEGTIGDNVNGQAAPNGNGGGGTDGSGADQGSSGGGGGYGAAGGAGANGQGTGGSGGNTVGDVAFATGIFFGGGGGGGRGEKSGSGNGGQGGRGGGIICPWARTITNNGSINARGDNGNPANPFTSSDGAGGGGGGAGGTVWFKHQTMTNAGAVYVSGGIGANGGNNESSRKGGDGGVGRIHADYLTTAATVNFSPSIDNLADSTLSDTPVGSGFTQYVGDSSGKIWTWDGASTYTQVFDARTIEWYDTGGDFDYQLGIFSATEYKRAQSFRLSNSVLSMKGVALNIKKNTAIQGITVRIETDASGFPSGTLANAGLTVDVPNSSLPINYNMMAIEFPAAVALSAATTYHIVVQSMTPGSETGYALIQADSTSSTYANGQMSAKAGAAAWTAFSTQDIIFRILSTTTSVNCSLISSLSGSQRMYFGLGDAINGQNGDARLISYDGTTWRVEKIFNTSFENAILSMTEFGTQTTKVYFGLGAKAKIYSTTDFSTYTLTKTISVPNNPGFVFDMVEYNGRLYACGGYPEQLYTANLQNSGFLVSYDEFSWTNIPGFEHTVLTTMEVYDNLLFVGSLKKRLYVYNTASIDKLEEFPWDIQVTNMIKFDDKLAISIAPRPGAASSGEEAVYIFDRNGFHNAFGITGVSFYSLMVFNNNLMVGADDGRVYQTGSTFTSSGILQTSYFEASLPSIDKNWRSIILHYDALLAGQSFLIEYKTDEADVSWTTVGTINTVGSRLTEINFLSNFYSKKLSLRITTTVTDQSATPKLKVMDLRYVLAPDLKYLWKLRLACADNLVWLDGTEPIAKTTAAITLGATTLVLNDASGFPSKHRAVVIDGGVEDEFSWTGRTGNTLTGVTGLLAHAATGLTVVMNAGVMHRLLLDLKRTKQFYTYTDIDSNSYNILFHNWSESEFVVNQDLGIENNVPISLLEA